MNKNTTTANPENNHPAITLANLHDTASKCAYGKIKFLYLQCPSDTIRDILNGFAHLDTAQDTQDIINVAALSMLESLNDPEINNADIFGLASNAVERYIWNQNKQHATTIHTAMYKKLLKIRKLLNGYRINLKGADLILAGINDISLLINFRNKLNQCMDILKNGNKNSIEYLQAKEQIIKYKNAVEYLGIITDKAITLENINYFIESEKAHAQKAYTSANMYIHDYEQSSGDIVNVNDQIAKAVQKLDCDTAIQSIIKALAPQQLKVFQYMALGYPDNVIASKMSISKARVSQHVKRIREIAHTIYPNGISDII